MLSGSSDSPDNARGDDAPLPPVGPLDPLATSTPETGPVPTSPPAAGDDERA